MNQNLFFGSSCAQLSHKENFIGNRFSIFDLHFCCLRLQYSDKTFKILIQLKH